MAPSYVRRSRSDRNHLQALSGSTKRPYQSSIDSHRSEVEARLLSVTTAASRRILNPTSRICSLVSKQPYQDVSIGLQTVPLVLSSAPQNGHESYANESITQNYINLAFGHVSPKPTNELDSTAHAMSHLARNYAVLYLNSSATTITSLHGSVGASITPIAELHLTGENVEGRKITLGGEAFIAERLKDKEVNYDSLGFGAM